MRVARDAVSSTTDTLSTPSVSPLPGSPNSNGNNAMAQGANYFFGFLITFIVLLLIFVACGVGSRRRLRFRRRQGGEGNLESWDLVRDGPSSQPEPTFWEAWLEQGSSPQWGQMTPLSASLLPFKRSKTSSSRRTSRFRPTTNNPSSNGRTVFSSNWFSRKWSGGSTAPRIDIEQPRNIQVATIIRMPNASPLHRQQDCLEEYQIGVACLPWEEEGKT